MGPLAVFAQNKPSGKTSPAKSATKVEDRRPPSEKLAEKPFTWNRKLMQNLVTRYNYYYHAKTRLEGIVKNIARQGADNYNALLPFYPYSLQDMGLNKSDLDSVILKASVAIQIHDPRGKWIDDCYLLIGRAYFYKGDWDNAAKTFQFMNAAFAPKKKSDYKAIVGSTENDRISVATREKRTGVTGRLKHINVRNDAFLWLARTLLEQKEYDQVQSLLNILESDPNFPSRLYGDLAEVKAYSYYKRGLYAETIDPLTVAIKASDNRESKARMSYILGQLYELQQRPDSAMDMFRDVIRLKPDPMMDFQARLQIARINSVAEGGSLEQSLAALQSMARKERFIPFRDAIYYMMASLAAPKDPEAAIGYLQQSLEQPSDNPAQRTLTFKALADVYYSQRKYELARNFYDSTAAVMPPGFPDSAMVTIRKEVLGDVAARVNAIKQEDSLQRIAAMPEAERIAFLEKMAADIQKAKEDAAKAAAGEEEDNDDNNRRNSSLASDMFARSNRGSGPKEDQGDWYFYNQNNKSSGFSEFKKRWGNRQLGDNWRRSGGSIGNFAGNQVNGEDNNAAMQAQEAAGLAPDSVTAQSLAAGLPLTPEKLQHSKTTQMDAWFTLGKLYHDKLDDAPLAIETYDSLLLKFPDHPSKPEVLYSLYAWHYKLNHAAEANKYKDMVLSQYGNTNFANIIRSGGVKPEANDARTKAVTALYNEAYLAYQSGNYTLPLEKKHLADSLYGLHALQPKFDLLEAMIIIKTDTLLTDSIDAGKQAIMAVINKYPNDAAIKGQAQHILDALNRRQQLETYLAQLQIRNRDSGGTMVDENISMRYPWQNPQPQFTDSVGIKTAGAKNPNVTASVAAPAGAAISAPPPPPPPKPATPYKLAADNPYFVVLSFKRVSKALLDEGLDKFTRYNATKHADDKIEVGSFVLSPSEVMLIFRLFPNEDKALAYFDEIREEAPHSIIPRIRPTDYAMFVISRDNFILLNNTKDLEGYQKFFSDNYVTQ